MTLASGDDGYREAAHRRHLKVRRSCLQPTQHPMGWMPAWTPSAWQRFTDEQVKIMRDKVFFFGLDPHLFDDMVQDSRDHHHVPPPASRDAAGDDRSRPAIGSRFSEYESPE